MRFITEPKIFTYKKGNAFLKHHQTTLENITLGSITIHRNIIYRCIVMVNARE